MHCHGEASARAGRSGRERRAGTGGISQLDNPVLANRSTCANANQRAGDLQGEGKTAIVLEEFSRYRDPARFWAQAHFLTQGKAGQAGGWVCAICNASPNEDWRKLKGYMGRGPDGRVTCFGAAEVTGRTVGTGRGE